MNYLYEGAAGFRRLYSFLPAAVAAVLAIGLALLSRITQPLNPKIIDTHVNILGLQSTRLQFLLYALCAAVVVGSTIILLITNKLAKQSEAQEVDKECQFSAWLLPGLLVLLSLSTSGNYKLPFFVSLAAVMPLLVLLGDNQKYTKWIRSGVIASCIAYVVGAYVIPFIFQYPISGIDYWVSHETHHAVTVLPGVDLARGQKLETSGGYYYGFIMPIGVFITSWITGLSPSDPLITVRTVQLFNILASILVLVLVYVQLPSKWKWLALMTLPLLPSLSLAHSSISHPNQAGIRYITLLLALLVLTVVSQRRQDSGSWILGASGGTLLAINLELGVCINTGFATYVLAKTLCKKNNLFLQSGLYAGSAALAFLAASSIAISAVTSNRDLSSLGYFVSMFGGSGYGGLVSTPSFLAIAAFFVAASVIITEALRITSIQGMNSERDSAFSCAIAMMLIAWPPYYVNRMSEWNLWIIPLLLLLITIDNLEGAQSSFNVRKDLGASLSASVLIPLTLATAFVGTRESAASMLGYARRIRQNNCALTSRSVRGHCKTDDIVHRVSQLDRLLDMPKARKSDYILLSPFHDTSGRIAGFNNKFPWHAAIGAITLEEIGEQSAWLDSKGPKFVLVPIAMESDSTSIKERIRHLELIADSATLYSKTEEKGGWSVYQRRR